MDLCRELKKILPENRVFSNMEMKIAYSYDATGLKSIPFAVVFPENEEEVSEIIKFASKNKIPVVPRGAGTGMSGGSVPVSGGIVISSERMNRIIEIDPVNFRAEVESGTVTGHIHRTVESMGLFYGPDPASSEFSTIGGNIAENSGGLRAVKYGVTRDWILGLRVVLPEGKILEFGKKTFKSVAGYDMVSLFTGSEGTLGFITKAFLKLIPKPECKIPYFVQFKTVEEAFRALIKIFNAKILPSSLEFIDKNTMDCMREFNFFHTQGGSALLVEIDGDEAYVKKEVKKLENIFEEMNALEIQKGEDEQRAREIWKLRRRISPSLFKIAPYKVNEDVVVERTRLLELLYEVYRIAGKFNVINANFGHAGDGNIHINFLHHGREDEIKRVQGAVDELMEVVLRLGGSISGEHGIGITKKKYIGKELGESMEIMRRIKKVLDPFNIMNPNKIFP